MAQQLLVAFDFDHTVVEKNTDIVVRDLLNDEKALSEIKGLYTSNGWTVYMEKIFELLHRNAVKKEEIEDAIAAIPAVTDFPHLLQQLYSNGVETIVISDSNSMFIEHWLKHNKLDHTVNEIFTNPAWFDKDGLLKIKMYHLQDWCKLSSRNLCKGQILESYIDKRRKEGVEFSRIAYVGDGRNDLCPVMRLSERDFAFPRVNYPLMQILGTSESSNGDRPSVKAEIISWNNGTDIWRELTKRVSNLDKIHYNL